MTRTIRSLEAKDLVACSANPNDRSATLVQLTDEGKAVVATFRAAVAETIGEILSPISEAQEAMLKDLLARALNHDTLD